jgi:DNA-binding transcriptional MocR family regulator
MRARTAAARQLGRIEQAVDRLVIEDDYNAEFRCDR